MPKINYKIFSPHGLDIKNQISNSSRLILLEANRLGVDWEVIPGTEVVVFNFQGKQNYLYHQVPSTTTALALYICNNKKTTSNLLFKEGISVPKGYLIDQQSSGQDLKDVYEDLSKPLVVKPSDGSGGDNITIDVDKPNKYQQALGLAFEHGDDDSSAIVEEKFEGKEYRILVTRDKVIGILNRMPANVLGDGKQTVKQLIEEKNAQEIRAEDGKHSHLKIVIDQDLLKNIAEQDLCLNDVPNSETRVMLRKTSNVSKGGDAIDCTDIAHQTVKEIALKVMATIPGLSFAGIDFITTDITQPQTEDSYVVIEVNSSPGFDIHDQPYEGQNRGAAREVLFLLFPELRSESKKNLFNVNNNPDFV